jgi:hypothetical protein
MSTKVPHNSEDQEIDLAKISKKIGNFFESLKISIFNGIQFFVRNWIIVLILIVAGFGLGMVLDKTQKNFDNQIIVTPNFGSVDYLYAKIDLLQSKIVSKDEVFFKKIGISEIPKITKIEIEPIVDVFKFVNNNEQNLEVLKLMTPNGDLKSIITEKTTSKNYPFYIISFSTTGILKNSNTVKALLNYLNTDSYYVEIQKISLNNMKQKVKANEEILLQIDGILSKFSNNESPSSLRNDKLVYYSENVQLNDIIKTKDGLIKENGELKLQISKSDKIIKESSVTTNIEETKSIKGKMKFVLPILFLFLYIFAIRFLSFYKRYSILNK